DDDEKRPQWQVGEVVEQHVLRHRLAVLVDLGRIEQATVEVLPGLVDSPAAKHGEPDDRDQGGHEHDAGNELTHSAPAGDSGDEDANKGRPRDPPAPVEDGPAPLPGLPVLTGVSGGMKGEFQDVL